MTLRGSLVIFGIGTALSWGAWALILTTVPPDAGGALGEAFFFGALFLALTGTLTILGVFGRRKTSNDLPVRNLGASFRQGVFLSFAAVGVLLLQRFRVLRWWNILILGGVLLILDLAFSSRRRRISP